MYNMTGFYGNKFSIWGYPQSGGGAERLSIWDNGDISFFNSASVERMKILDNGNIGIGINPGGEKLAVNGTGMQYGKIASFLNGNANTWVATTTTAGAWNSITKAGDNGIYWQDDATVESANGFVIAPWSAGTNGIRIDGLTGNVGIGDANPSAKLQIKSNVINALDIVDNTSGAVNFRVKSTGIVYAREVNVQLGVFPDYVFEKDYQLLPLEKLESFIAANKHLPNIPSANEVCEKGMNVGELQRLQMEKIEELTLYIIQLKKELEGVKKELEGVKTK